MVKKVGHKGQWPWLHKRQLIDDDKGKGQKKPEKIPRGKVSASGRGSGRRSASCSKLQAVGLPAHQ